jgi:hypothetical protein
MDKKTVFGKTPKGESEMRSMSGDMKRVMLLIDEKSTLDEVTRRAPPSLRGDLPEILQQLLDAELIRDKDKAVAAPKITAPKMATPKPAAAVSNEELDFTTVFTAPTPAEMAAEAAKQKARQAAEAQAKHDAEAARARAELEAAVAAAKLKASAEAEAKAEAKARLEAEFAARAKAEADARARHEAVERQLAEAKAKQEAEARMRAEQEAARVKAELEAVAKAKAEAEARVRAEIEAAARARQEVEAKAREEAEAARLKAEQEAARVKAELEAVAKAKAEAEAARIKAEQEAARVKAELEAAKARAEAEARALAEERARQEAEAARLNAEQEAARIKAEQEAAARAKADMEERARQEAEAARVKAEQAAVLVKAEHEAAVRARAEAEEHARRVAEAANLQAEQDEAARVSAAAAARLEAEEKAHRDAQFAGNGALAASAKQISALGGTPFSINLDALNTGAIPASTQSTFDQPQHIAQPETEQPLRDKQEAEHRAAADAKAAEEQKARQNAAAEMARLKAEQEAARLRAEQEARSKEEEQALAAEQADAWAEAEQRAKLQAKLDAEQSAQQAALSQAKAVQKPAARARRGKPLPLGKIAFSLIALALLVVIVLPYVWPLQKYIAPLEQRLSAQLKQPVHIGGMSASSLPPRLQLQNVTMGNAQEVKVVAVVLNFDPLSLFSAIKEISNAELQSVALDGRNLDQVAGWLKGLGGDAQYPLHHLTIKSLQVNSEGVNLPSMQGSADLAQGAFTRVMLHSEDEKLNVELQAAQNNSWQLSFGIKERALPLLPGVMFGDFSAKGDISDGEVNFTEIDAHAYGGIWSGRGKLGWRKGWQVQGRIQAKTMELEKLFPQFGLSGEVFAEGNFSSQSAKLAQLGDAPRLDGSFMAKNGVINGMDMTETARLSSQEHLPGGRTNFDELTGALQLENHNLHFRQVKIASGTLIANGSFDVTAGSQLSGSFNAVITMRAGNNPLVMSGTLTEPKLRAR